MRSGDPEISGCRFETLETQREPFLIWAILGAIWQMHSGAMEPLCESMRSTAILHSEVRKTHWARISRNEMVAIAQQKR